MLNDLRHAIRSLAKTPGFTLAVIGTLALGIGATSAVFSVFDAVLLQPLPYRRPERLVRMVGGNPHEVPDSPTISYPDYIDAVNESAAFTLATVFTEWHPSLSGERSAEILNGAVVDSPYFDVFGVKPERGRFFTRREDRPGQDDMVVISHALWLRQFGGGDIVGKPIRIDGRTLTVAGIVPADFEDPHMTSPRDLEIWTTIAPTGGNDWARSGRALNSVARLRDGVSLAMANARVKAVAARLRARYPRDNANQDLGVVLLRDSLVGDVRRPMILVLCASALLLLMACVNVMNLVLARTSRRATEIRVRIALGASGRYLVRQFAAEAIVLATLGGAAGVVLASWLVKLFIRIGGHSVPRSLAVTIDHRVLLVALGSTLVVAVVTSLLPALHAFRDRSAGPSATRGTTAGIATQHTQTTLVVAQVAISVVVIATAMLLGRSLWNLMHVSKGIDERGVLAMTVRAPRENYPKRADVAVFYAALLQSVQALPGVEHVATASILPFDGDHSCDGFALPDRPELDRDRPCAEARIVSPGFFETMSATVIRGRGLTEADSATSGPVTVVDESFARKYFGTRDPIGRVISVHGQKRTIVGIAAPVRLLKVSDVPVPLIYTAEEQDERAFRSRSLVLRTAKDPMSFVPAIRNIVFRLSPAAPMADVRTMRDVITTSLAPQRFRAILIGGFGLAALLLATVGIAGVLGFAVSQRVREIGIRLALGSTGAGVVALVLRRAMQLVLLGTVIGSAAALIAGRFVGVLLFDVSPNDPMTFVAVISVLAATGALAAAIPAMRAARVEPMTALRSE